MIKNKSHACVFAVLKDTTIFLRMKNTNACSIQEQLFIYFFIVQDNNARLLLEVRMRIHLLFCVHLPVCLSCAFANITEQTNISMTKTTPVVCVLLCCCVRVRC
jgi:hypothetical protein